MLHETISCNLLVDVAEIQQGQRSTDTIPKSRDYPKGCISNPLITSLDLKDGSIRKEVPSFLPRKTHSHFSSILSKFINIMSKICLYTAVLQAKEKPCQQHVALHQALAPISPS